MTASFNELIEQGDTASVRALLDSDRSLAQQPNEGDYPIIWAAANDKAEIVALLIQYGADKDFREDDGRTPLHRAAESGPETVKVLLKHGANPNVLDKWGYTPLVWAISGQQPEGEESARLLREAGANYDLIAATAMGDLATVRSIIQRDPDAVKTAASGETLLSMAWTVRRYGTLADRVEIVKELFSHGLKVKKEILTEHVAASETQKLGEIAQLLRAQVKRKCR